MRLDVLILIVFIALMIFAGCSCDDDDDDNDSDNGVVDDDFSDDDDVADDDVIDDDDDVINDDDDDDHNCDFSFVTQMMQGYADGGIDSGMAIFTADHILYEKYFGEYNYDTVVPLASSSKMPSATALLMMVDEGAFALDDLIMNYLPNWSDDPTKQLVTMRMTMSHTHGFPGQAWLACMPDGTYDMVQCAEHISEQNLLATPGNWFGYGGTGLQLAGGASMAISGQDWYTFFNERLGTPLGLTHFDYWDAYCPIIGTNAESNMMDYVKFMQIFLGGGVYEGERYLSEAIVNEALTDQLSEVPLTVYSYGLGWWVTKPADQDEPFTKWNVAGGWGALPWIDIELGYGAFVFIQDQWETGWDIQEAMVDAIEAEIQNCLY